MAGLSTDDLAQIEVLCPTGVARDVDLSAISRWRIGGRARVFIRPASIAQVAALRQFFWQRGLRHIVIGQTSNVLFADEGLDVPCIQIGPGLSRVDITGTLGGLVCMNGGSQRKGIGDSITTVESVDTTGAIRRRPARDCDFAYRRSVFQRNDEIVTAAHLRLSPADPSEIRSTMRAILADRRQKFPRKQPNCGSVFKSNPAMYAAIGTPGAVIERLGLKGLQVGGAQVSPLHANFIINTGGARACDVLGLIMRISNIAEAATGHRMEAEVCYVTPTGDILPANSALEPNL